MTVPVSQRNSILKEPREFESQKEGFSQTWLTETHLPAQVGVSEPFCNAEISTRCFQSRSVPENAGAASAQNAQNFLDYPPLFMVRHN